MSKRLLEHDAAIYFKLPSELKEAAEEAAFDAEMTLAAWLRQLMRRAVTENKKAPADNV